MKIGALKLANPVIAAPMAGISDRVYRQLALEQGCALTCSEMISDQALLYANHKTLMMLDFDNQYPLSAQLFGSDPRYMAEAAAILEDKGTAVIDINMGCPVPKVVKNNEGSALLKDLKLAESIICAIVNKVSLPVTVKIRKGWDQDNVNAVEAAIMAETAGAAAVTVHGRTRQQFYSGKADWDIIKKVKNNVSIPVIGNGDIFCPQDAQQMMQQTGCDAVMIGRGALGNPWIFCRTVAWLEKGQLPEEPTAQEKIAMALRHLELLIHCKGEHKAGLEMRKHASYYTKGLANASQLRDEINRTADLKGLLETYLLREYS